MRRLNFEKKIFYQFHLRLQTTTQLVFSLNPPRTSGNSTRRDPDFGCVLCKFVEDGDRDELELELVNQLFTLLLEGDDNDDDNVDVDDDNDKNCVITFIALPLSCPSV